MSQDRSSQNPEAEKKAKAEVDRPVSKAKDADSQQGEVCVRPQHIAIDSVKVLGSIGNSDISFRFRRVPELTAKALLHNLRDIKESSSTKRRSASSRG